MISLLSGIERRSNFRQQTKMRGGGQTNFCGDKNLVEAAIPAKHTRITWLAEIKPGKGSARLA